MCLAVPGKILSISDEGLLTMARVDFHGVVRDICIDTVDAREGDYVVAHAGVAVSVMDASTALATIGDLERMTLFRESVRGGTLSDFSPSDAIGSEEDNPSEFRSHD